MLEFKNFVYLDVQKTGSTYIRHFLQNFSRTPWITDQRHGPVDRYDSDKLYIISCRDPLPQYLSLYSFGCREKGKLRRRLARAGMANFYDGTIKGFTGWLELVVDPATGQKYLEDLDNHPILDLIGLQSLRFLRMAFPAYLKVFETINEKNDVKDRLKTDGLYKVLLKTETLTDDLTKLLKGEFGGILKEPAAAEKWLAETRRKNVSPEMGIDLAALSPEIVSLVQAREWLFFEELQYQPYI